MENLYKQPRRFDEPSNNLIVFRFPFSLLLPSCRCRIERCYIISLSHKGRGVASTVFCYVAFAIVRILKLERLAKLRKVSRVKKDYSSQRRLVES